MDERVVKNFSEILTQLTATERTLLAEGALLVPQWRGLPAGRRGIGCGL
jgi:hypothetical protein